MGKIQDVILSLGYRRKEAEKIEDRLLQAGIKEEEEKPEAKRKLVVKNISEVVGTSEEEVK